MGHGRPLLFSHPPSESAGMETLFLIVGLACGLPIFVAAAADVIKTNRSKRQNTVEE